ncbi:MAG TPA: PCI domain-containing protein, partial [Candidatus Lokiarchaeia archaeon]|nr:PCI domain-containing protein [Candidatus Lokiarchaeia archaeon]
SRIKEQYGELGAKIKKYFIFIIFFLIGAMFIAPLLSLALEDNLSMGTLFIPIIFLLTAFISLTCLICIIARKQAPLFQEREHYKKILERNATLEIIKHSFENWKKFLVQGIFGNILIEANDVNKKICSVNVPILKEMWIALQAQAQAEVVKILKQIDETLTTIPALLVENDVVTARQNLETTQRKYNALGLTLEVGPTLVRDFSPWAKKIEIAEIQRHLCDIDRAIEENSVYIAGNDIRAARRSLEAVKEAYKNLPIPPEQNSSYQRDFTALEEKVHIAEIEKKLSKIEKDLKSIPESLGRNDLEGARKILQLAKHAYSVLLIPPQLKTNLQQNFTTWDNEIKIAEFKPQVRNTLISLSQEFTRVLLSEVSTEVSVPFDMVEQVVYDLITKDQIPALYDEHTKVIEFIPEMEELDELRKQFDEWGTSKKPNKT